MYYLTHVYLSGNNQKVMVGNFIQEVHPSWTYTGIDEDIKRGIELNELISNFCVNHPIVQRSLGRFKKNSKLSNKALFIYYDHLLAANWEKYSETSLRDFASNTYKILLENSILFPYKVKALFPAMIRSNWLVKMTTIAGMTESVKELGKLTYRPWNLEQATNEFMENYADFKQDFEEFMPLLKEYVMSLELAELNNRLEIA